MTDKDLKTRPIRPVTDLFDVQLEAFTAKGEGDPAFTSSPHVIAGSKWVGKVRLTGDAPAGLVIQFASGNTSKLGKPADIHVQMGQREWEFPLPTTAPSYGGLINKVALTASLKAVRRDVLVSIQDAPK